MKIVAISDTHNRANELIIPEADLLIHVGDWSNQGTTKELKHFCKWISSLVTKNILITFGNHEKGAEGREEEYVRAIESSREGVKVLLHKSYELGGLKFFGSQWTNRFFDWGYQINRGPEAAAKWAQIPDDTDVLFTHQPPNGILDVVNNERFGYKEHAGCKALRYRAEQLHLKLHVYGHLHQKGGCRELLGNTVYANVAMLDDQMRSHDSQPQVFDL